MANHHDNVVLLQRFEGCREHRTTIQNLQVQVNALREELVAERTSKLRNHSDQAGLTDIEVKVLLDTVFSATQVYELWKAGKELDKAMLCLGNDLASLSATRISGRVR
jgi:hypothetical protein